MNRQNNRGSCKSLEIINVAANVSLRVSVHALQTQAKVCGCQHVTFAKASTGDTIHYCTVTLSERTTEGLLGSFEETCTVLRSAPFLPVMSIFAVIFPFSPGFRWLELAIAAAQPQDEPSF